MTKSIFIFSIFLFISCSSADTPKISVTFADTNIYTIIPFDTADKKIDIFKNCFPADLVMYELAVIDSFLNISVDRFNKFEAQKQLDIWTKSYGSEGAELSNFKINLANYKRQYMVVVNDKEQKEVWVNCFKEDEDPAFKNLNWKHEIVQADGGGMNYFQFKINLTTRRSSDIKINPFE